MSGAPKFNNLFFFVFRQNLITLLKFEDIPFIKGLIIFVLVSWDHETLVRALALALVRELALALVRALCFLTFFEDTSHDVEPFMI